VLCVYRMRHPLEPTAQHSPTDVVTEYRRLRLKIGPLWKLMQVVEPAAAPLDALPLRDEKNEAIVLDGPFAETKESFGASLSGNAIVRNPAKRPAT
jgi:hypothetical protein